MNQITDLVLTKEIIYKTLESKVNLVCPIETTQDITWSGPPEFILYAVGTDVSSRVSTLVEVKKTDTDKKSVLIIHRFTEDISGEFRCSGGLNIREFNLVIKSKNCKHKSFFPISNFYLSILFNFVLLSMKKQKLLNINERIFHIMMLLRKGKNIV